ncbi:alanine:cation symporter family protein [Sandaracinobacter sp. RS1-74]|uniref:alanine/glycine:cation symporter family protein n=1 Tax=Sandaracinobacteroides sayramensis TaxID=2913411 RepID=UPI001EDBD2B0|nr:amino acid carrier protein [Sandaracinobacteroides sayramensis]MCG2842543.1 alanine:cation symporter family protein [Sandaracinobacteroides sayramensis]
MSAIALIEAGIDRLSGFVFATVPIGGVEVQLVVLWLAVAMVFMTFWLGIPQVRGFSEAWRILRGRYWDPSAPGEVSQFAALTTALSGTIGLGNIAGIGVALTVGGPGAIFWMFVIGLFAMGLKCAEVTLGLMFREELSYGRVRGGAWVTLERGLASIGLPKLGRGLGLFHAFLMIGGSLSLFQVNQAFPPVAQQFGVESRLGFGLFFAFMVALVLLGSIRWIGRATSVLVPAMSLIFMAGCLTILFAGFERIPGAIGLIVSEAFTAESAFGGMLGAFVTGMRRAIYSCEAGLGTAVAAHAQAKTRQPASEGLVALIEPFMDTVVMCTITGIAFVVAGTWDPATNGGLQGVEIATAAFATISSWFPMLLAVAVFLFAYATVIANGFYAAEACQYLFGHGRKRELAVKAAFCCILPLGVILEMGKIVDFVDSVYFLMAVPNIIGLYLLAKPLRAEMQRYFHERQLGN